ncbi:MAG TPA: hypothetical protein VK787_16120 [Puia sp.]|nr:hypothetical protein [Puia sp.]
MPAAGYSGTPLIKKLGIAENMKVLLINAPENYFDLLEKNISDQLTNKKITPDLVHFFAKTNREFEIEMKQLKKICTKNPNVIIWVSWYKKSSGIETDITENEIRNYALKNDLIDIKVCAVSEDWSGLKLVVPKNKR